MGIKINGSIKTPYRYRDPIVPKGTRGDGVVLHNERPFTVT